MSQRGFHDDHASEMRARLAAGLGTSVEVLPTQDMAAFTEPAYSLMRMRLDMLRMMRFDTLRVVLRNQSRPWKVHTAGRFRQRRR